MSLQEIEPANPCEYCNREIGEGTPVGMIHKTLRALTPGARDGAWAIVEIALHRDCFPDWQNAQS